MPLQNYCRKCAREVSVGDACPHCGAKLTKTGERLSFQRRSIPVRDWFAWNRMLRVTVPVIGLILSVTVVLEGIAEGADGIRNVFLQGFFGTLLAVFGWLLLATFLLLSLQGEEMIRYVLDTKGIHVYTLMNHPGLLPLYARMTTPAAVETLSAATNDATTDAWRTVRRVELPWSSVRRVRLWPETDTILLYHPTWWQAVYIRCDAQDYEDALAYLQKKIGKKKALWGKTRKKR